MQKTTFQEELARWGPDGGGEHVSTDGAIDYCRRLATSHYENFSVATFLLPKELRTPFCVVYAYCRWSDDLADEHDGSEPSRKRSLELLDWWQRGLDDCFNPGITLKHPVFIALQEIAREFRLEKKPFEDLLKAFRQDQLRQRYERMDELLDYCRFSADPVGRIVLALIYATLGETPSNRQLAWSDSICTGLQLANFWQDVARDAAVGRSYIPHEIASQYGFKNDPDSWRDAAEFRAMIRQLVSDARERLLAGEPLIRSVPKRFRVDIALFVRGGLAVLDEIEKNGYNVLQRRPVVSRWKKIRLLLRAWFLG